VKESSVSKRTPLTLIRYLFLRQTSAFLIILGRRGTGKTDFALLIAELLHRQRIIKHFATNIKIYESPFQIERITSLEDLKIWCRETPGRKLFIPDEYGKILRRRTPMSKLSIKLIDELQILRKFKLSTIAITVDEKYVDNVALGSDILDGYFLKPDYKNQKFALYQDLLEYFDYEIHNIPGTQIRFDTWDVAPFTEFSQDRKPRFKDKDIELLWRWTQGEEAKSLGLHRGQLSRIRKKFVKETLERMRNKEHI